MKTKHNLKKNREGRDRQCKSNLISSVSFSMFLSLFIFSFLFFLLPLASSEKFSYGETEDIPINYSLIPTVNNSQYLQGLTPEQVANLFDASSYYLKSNPYNFYNSTTLPETNLTGYWTSNGSSTATGNWNLGNRNFIANRISAGNTTSGNFFDLRANSDISSIIFWRNNSNKAQFQFIDEDFPIPENIFKLIGTGTKWDIGGFSQIDINDELHLTENLNTTKNITAKYFKGNGSQLVGIPQPNLTGYALLNGSNQTFLNNVTFNDYVNLRKVIENTSILNVIGAGTSECNGLYSIVSSSESTNIYVKGDISITWNKNENSAYMTNDNELYDYYISYDFSNGSGTWENADVGESPAPTSSYYSYSDVNGINYDKVTEFNNAINNLNDLNSTYVTYSGAIGNVNLGNYSIYANNLNNILYSTNPSGLDAYYRMDDYNSSGIYNYLNNSFYFNKVQTTLTDGYTGQALNFNGSAYAYSNLNDTNFYEGKIFFRFKRNAVSGNYEMLVTRSGGGSTDTQYEIRISPANKLQLVATTTAGYQAMTSTTTFNDLNWHNIYIVVTDNYWALYVDGVLDASAFVGALSKNIYSTTILGARVSGTYEYKFNGKLDDLMFFNSSTISLKKQAQLENYPMILDKDILSLDTLNVKNIFSYGDIYSKTYLITNSIKSLTNENITFFNSSGTGYANLNAKSFNVFSPKDTEYSKDYLTRVAEPISILDKNGKLERNYMFENERKDNTPIEQPDKPIYETITYEECNYTLDKPASIVDGKVQEPKYKKICETKTKEVLIGYETKYENATDIGAMSFNNRLLISELKAENELLKARLDELESNINFETTGINTKESLEPKPWWEFWK